MNNDKKGLLAAGDLLADYTGSCPHDLDGWEHPATCEKHCSEDAPPRCWVEYIRSIAGNMALYVKGEKNDVPRND